MLNLLKTLNRLVFDAGNNSILTNALDTVLASLLGGLYFGSSDYFAIACLKIKLDAAGNLFYNKFSHNNVLREFYSGLFTLL